MSTQEGFRRLSDGLAHIVKAPGDALDYSLDWAAWLRTGEAIASSVWTVPAGLNLSSSGVDGAATVAWISGGVAGTAYQVDNAVTTDGSPPRIAKRSFVIDIKAALS